MEALAAEESAAPSPGQKVLARLGEVTVTEDEITERAAAELLKSP